VAVAVLALVPARMAHAATKTVDLGVPVSAQKTVNETLGGDVNDFFPHGITIHAGDSVKFAPVNFHSVEFTKKNTDPAGLFGPTGKKVTENDPAGAPYWFNGLDELSFTPTLAAKSGFGKKFKYTGKTDIASGLPFGNKPKPMTVKFPKPGSITYYCNVHPGMKGSVKVVAKGKKIPTAKQDKKTVAAQVKRSIKEVTALSKTTAAAGTVVVGPSGPHGSELYSFVPAATTVPVGTTLKYVSPPAAFDVHTATFGPDNPEVETPTGYLGTLTATLNGPSPDQALLYPSDPPGAPASVTQTSHGVGFWNTGAIDTSTSTPLPAEGSVTFAQAGTYNFYCLIHPFMHQVVTVT
jgi:plastocyanin